MTIGHSSFWLNCHGPKPYSPSGIGFAAWKSPE